MWRFLDLAEPVINRADNSNGSVGDVFRSACEDLGAIAVRARPNPAVLAHRVFVALLANDYGVYDPADEISNGTGGAWSQTPGQPIFLLS